MATSEASRLNRYELRSRPIIGEDNGKLTVDARYRARIFRDARLFDVAFAGRQLRRDEDAEVGHPDSPPLTTLPMLHQNGWS